MEKSVDRDPVAEDIRGFLRRTWGIATRHGLSIMSEPDPETRQAILVARHPAQGPNGAPFVSWGISCDADQDRAGKITESWMQLFVRLTYEPVKEHRILIWRLRTDTDWKIVDDSVPSPDDAALHDRIFNRLSFGDGIDWETHRLTTDDTYALIERMCRICAEGLTMIMDN